MRFIIWLGAGMFGMPAVVQNPSSTVVTFYVLLMLSLAGYLAESRMWDRQEKARKKAEREAARAVGQPNVYTFLMPSWWPRPATLAPCQANVWSVTMPSWWPRQSHPAPTYARGPMPGPGYGGDAQRPGEPPIIDAEVVGEWA